MNDHIGYLPLAVTYCPLCNTALVFDRRHGGRMLDFGPRAASATPTS